MTRFFLIAFLFTLKAQAEYGLPMRPINSGQLSDGNVIFRASAAETDNSSSFLSVGWAWDPTAGHYKGLIKSSSVTYGFPNGSFKKSTGWNPGEQLYDFAGAGFENLCNALVYAYDGFIVACRSMTAVGKYSIYLVKVDSSGNLMTDFGTGGIKATGLGGSTDHALIRGIAYNSSVNVSNHGVVAIVGAKGSYAPGHFNPFIAAFDQKTGALFSSAVLDNSFSGTAVGISYDSSSNAYYVAATETKSTNHFYINKYTTNSDRVLVPDTTHSWDTAIDFTNSISGGAAHSIPSSITVKGGPNSRKSGGPNVGNRTYVTESSA